MPDGLLERIVRDSGVPDLVEILSARLAPTDLQSLMMEVYRRRAATMTTTDLLDRVDRDRFCRPAEVDPSAVSSFETMAWSLLPDGYEAVELSPLCPLGTNSVIATVDQHKIVSTARNTEVVADSTAALALICAQRRRRLLASSSTQRQNVDLAACQRQVRAQGVTAPRSWAHFRLLALVSAGRDRGSRAFEAETTVDHVTYLATLLACHQPGCRVHVAVTDLCDRSSFWQESVLDVLSERLPELSVGMNPSRQSGRSYYTDVCFKIELIAERGERIEVGDGGCTTWTRQLLSDSKERLAISGLGVDRLLRTEPGG